MKFVTPNYLQNFKCDGSLCDSYCCREWKIIIDENTKEKYKNLPSEKYEKILSSIEKKEDNCSYLKLKDNGSCPFLRDDWLCELQKNLGEDYLSNICYSYPRIATKTKDTLFQSLTLSCPLAAELVLFSNEISFVETDVIPPRIGWCIDIENRVPIFNEDVEDMLSAGLFILKDNFISIDKRLEMLFEFYSEAENIANDNKKLDELLNSVENEYFYDEISNKKEKRDKNIIFQKEEFLKIERKLFNAIYETNISDEKFKSLTEIYNENIYIFEKFVLQNSQIFTNYLMNEFFMRVYPYAFKESFSMNIKIFILSWRALYFALFMLYIDGGLTKERLIFGVRLLVEKIDHGKGTMQKIMDIARLYK